jgi:HAD superfamily hydrolase (TIGR01509 family)
MNMISILPQKPRAIILDMDGVLADTEPIHVEAFRAMLLEYGIEADDQFLNSFIGHSIENNVEAINETFFKSDPLPVAKTTRYRDDIYLEMLKAAELEPMPGILELLQLCQKKGITLALASSSIREQIDVILSRLTNHARGELSYESCFSVIVSGDMVADKKPARDIYQLALKKLDLRPDDCFAVEDSAAGIQSAQAAGLKCVFLKNVYSIETEISIADHQIVSLNEIVSFLAR